MADYKNSIKIIQAKEGGLSSDPNDSASANPVPDGSGNHTNKGITWTSFVAYGPQLGYNPTPALFYQMPDNIWGLIYKKIFWDKFINGDQIKSDSIAILLVDFTFNAGYNAGKQLQKVLNANFGYHLTVDGQMGPQTLAAVNAVDQNKLLDLFQAARLHYYQNVVAANPKDQKFYDGWISRANDVYAFAKTHAVSATISIGTLFFWAGLS